MNSQERIEELIRKNDLLKKRNLSLAQRDIDLTSLLVSLQNMSIISLIIWKFKNRDTIFRRMS